MSGARPSHPPPPTDDPAGLALRVSLGSWRVYAKGSFAIGFQPDLQNCNLGVEANSGKIQIKLRARWTGSDEMLVNTELSLHDFSFSADEDRIKATGAVGTAVTGSVELQLRLTPNNDCDEWDIAVKGCFDPPNWAQFGKQCTSWLTLVNNLDVPFTRGTESARALAHAPSAGGPDGAA